MQYEVITAADLDTLSEAVGKQLKQGWKLKDQVFEHVNGFAQELMRSPMECVHRSYLERQRRRKRWIEIE